MRISDGSSEVCSADRRAVRSLDVAGRGGIVLGRRPAFLGALHRYLHYSVSFFRRSSPGLLAADARWRRDIGPQVLADLLVEMRHHRLELLDEGLGAGELAGEIAHQHHLEAARHQGPVLALRSEEHTSELQSLMRISYAVFCLKKK